MDSVKHLHDDKVQISTMLRYVAADEMMLSPCTGRDTAVMSFIVVGDEEASGDQGEFSMYAHGLQALTEKEYSGRPHWGKVNYAAIPGGGGASDYLRRYSENISNTL